VAEAQGYPQLTVRLMPGHIHTLTTEMEAAGAGPRMVLAAAVEAWRAAQRQPAPVLGADFVAAIRAIGKVSAPSDGAEALDAIRAEARTAGMADAAVEVLRAEQAVLLLGVTAAVCMAADCDDISDVGDLAAVWVDTYGDEVRRLLSTSRRRREMVSGIAGRLCKESARGVALVRNLLQGG